MTAGCGSSEPGRASPGRSGRSRGRSQASRVPTASPCSWPKDTWAASRDLQAWLLAAVEAPGTDAVEDVRSPGLHTRTPPTARSPPPGPAGGGAPRATRSRPAPPRPEAAPQDAGSRGALGSLLGGRGAEQPRRFRLEGNSDPGLPAPSASPRAGLAPDEAIPARPASEPHADWVRPRGRRSLLRVRAPPPACLVGAHGRRVPHGRARSRLCERASESRPRGRGSLRRVSPWRTVGEQ